MYFPLQLRKSVFDFFQKELAPKAAQIDKDNNFPELRVSLFLVAVLTIFTQ